MKIDISIEITPEEARRLYGLPDLSTLHADILGKVQEAVAKNDMGVLGKLAGPLTAAGLKSIEDYNKMLWSLFSTGNKKKEHDTGEQR